MSAETPAGGRTAPSWQLRAALGQMVLRYGAANREFARAATDEQRVRASRACERRFAAVQRLANALTGLAKAGESR